jgi:hypothetical protein
MNRFLATIFILAVAVGALAYPSSGPAPKAVASPAPVIDHSAELAALQAENADLKEQLASTNLPAMQVAEPAAPLAVIAPGGGDQNWQKQPVSRETPAITHVSAGDHYGPTRSQCAGGVCQPAAQAPKQYQYQSRSSQPRRLFSGRIFGRR